MQFQLYEIVDIIKHNSLVTKVYNCVKKKKKKKITDMTMCIFRLACLLLQKAKCTDYESSKGIVSIFRGVRILPNFTGTGDVILQDRFHVLDKTLRTGLWTKHPTGNTGSLPVPFQPLDQITKINDYGLTTKNVKVNKIWAVY